MKTQKDKESLLEQFKKTPIVQIACQQSGVSRASFYRWKKEDSEFAKRADEAIAEGLLLINDLAESQLISAIRDKNMAAIALWLRQHHPRYAHRVEVTAEIKNSDHQLTPEQKALAENALRLANLPALDAQETYE